MRQTIKLAPEVKEQIENCLYEFPMGKTLKKIFRECEKAGAAVYWGLWTEEQLNCIAV